VPASGIGRQLSSQHLTNPLGQEMRVEQSPKDQAHDPAGHRTMPAGHMRGLPAVHSPTEVRHEPSWHCTGISEGHVGRSCPQPARLDTKLFPGHRTVAHVGPKRGSEGGAQRVAFWAQIPLWHSTGLAGGHWTLVGHSLASSTHDPTEQVTVPSGHVCSGGHDTRLPLHEPSQHLMGYVGGHERIMGHSFLFAWQLPSGHRTSDRAQARAVAEGHSVDE